MHRLKDDEIPKYWDKAMDKVIEVNLRRIAHSKSGKASIIGEIVESTPGKQELYVSQPSRRQIFDGQNPSARAVR